VRSWLCELAARAFEQDGNDLATLEGWVEDSGEGRWTLVDAIDHDVPMPALSAALFSRFYSRQTATTRQGCSPPCATSSVGTPSSRRPRREARGPVTLGGSG